MRRAGVRLVVVLLDLARAGVLRMVRVVVWRRQALGRVGVMLLGECGQQTNDVAAGRLGRRRCRNKQTNNKTRGGSKVRYKTDEAQAQRPGCGAGQGRQ